MGLLQEDILVSARGNPFNARRKMSFSTKTGGGGHIYRPIGLSCYRLLQIAAVKSLLSVALCRH